MQKEIPLIKKGDFYYKKYIRIIDFYKKVC